MTTLTLMNGDCVAKMKELDDNSIDAILCDPPYGLKFMNKDFDDLGEGKQQKEWHVQWVREAYRVLKPDGVMKAFGGTRTYQHLLAAMAEVGFEVSLLGWVYGSGFPKSLNISRAFDRKRAKETGEVGDIIGYTKGVGGENLNDIVAGKEVRTNEEDGGKGVGAYGTGAKQVSVDVPVREWVTEEAKTWEGWGTSLKPAFEPVCVGHKRV